MPTNVRSDKPPLVRIPWEGYTEKVRISRPLLEALQASKYATGVRRLVDKGYAPLYQSLRDRGLARSGLAARDQARNGTFSIDGRPLRIERGFVYFISSDASITSVEPEPVVTRAAWKLKEAFERWPGATLRNGKLGPTALDLGTSYGGFAQTLLQEGFSKVDCIECGKEMLHESLRADPRIRSFEGVDVREFIGNGAIQPVDLITVDLVTISLLEMLPLLPSCLLPQGGILGVIKPRNEVRVPKTVRDFVRVNARELRYWPTAETTREISQRRFARPEQGKFHAVLQEKMDKRRTNRDEWRMGNNLSTYQLYGSAFDSPQEYYRHLFDRTLQGASILGFDCEATFLSSTQVSTQEMIGLFRPRPDVFAVNNQSRPRLAFAS